MRGGDREKLAANILSSLPKGESARLETIRQAEHMAALNKEELRKDRRHLQFAKNPEKRKDLEMRIEGWKKWIAVWEDTLKNARNAGEGRRAEE